MGSGPPVGSDTDGTTGETTSGDFRDHSHTPSAPMATPPSTAHTVDQCEAGCATGAATVVEAESTAVRVFIESAVTESAVGWAQAPGTPLSSSISRASSNGRLPLRGQPAGWDSRAGPVRLIERLRVMKHLG